MHSRPNYFSPLSQTISYMPREPIATLESNRPPNDAATPSSSSHHGSLHHEPIGLYRVHSAASSSSRSSSARSPRRDSADDGVDADQLDEKLRGLRLRSAKGSRRNNILASAPGQRIADYENALTPPTPKQALGFKVVKRAAGEPGGTLLTDIPNGQQCLPTASLLHFNRASVNNDPILTLLQKS